MKSLLVTSIAAIVLVGSIQAQSCGPYWEHSKCFEGDEPCCSAFGQCGASQLHCKWTGRYQNTNQSAGSCLYSPCSSKTDCCDKNTGNCMWNPDGQSDEQNMCKEGVNYNKMEYDIPKKTMPPATTSASTAKPTTAPPTTKPTTAPTETPKPTSNTTVAPTSQATTKPTTKPTKSPKPTSNATMAPTSSPKPTSNVTQQPTSQATHKPTKYPCTPECPVEHCNQGYCNVPTMQPTSQSTTPPPTSNATASPCKHPPCKSCHNDECYEHDDGYNGAALANSGVAFALAVIYLAATFAI